MLNVGGGVEPGSGVGVGDGLLNGVALGAGVGVLFGVSAPLFPGELSGFGPGVEALFDPGTGKMPPFDSDFEFDSPGLLVSVN